MARGNRTIPSPAPLSAGTVRDALMDDVEHLFHALAGMRTHVQEAMQTTLARRARLISEDHGAADALRTSLAEHGGAAGIALRAQAESLSRRAFIAQARADALIQEAEAAFRDAVRTVHRGVRITERHGYEDLDGADADLVSICVRSAAMRDAALREIDSARVALIGTLASAMDDLEDSLRAVQAERGALGAHRGA